MREEDNGVPLSEFDDVIEGPGFIMARKGRYIFSQNLLDQEQFHAHMQELVNHLGEFQADIEKDVVELENILRQYNPFDIMANVALLNSIHDIETYKEYEHREIPAFTEYISNLLLTKPFEYYAQRTPYPISGRLIEEIQEKVLSIFTKQMFFLAFKDINPKQARRDILTELRFHTLTQSLVVRSMSYHHHIVELLKELFHPIGNELNQLLGFSVTDCLVIADSIVEIMNNKLNDRRTQGIEFEKDFQRAVKKYRRKKQIVGEFTEDVIMHLANLKPSKEKEEIAKMSIAWIFLGIGDTLSFGIEELIQASNLTSEIVKNYLSKFEIKFGQVDPILYRIPAPTHQLTTKPIIEHDGRYFCPVSLLLYYGLQQAIEIFLNPGNPNSINKNMSLWEKYERVRANYVENKAVEYVSNAVKHGQVYQKLKYHVIEAGDAKEVELDGLVLIDSAIFLIEAKAGTMSLPARRGAKKRMIEELGELVEEAYGQVFRAKRYIMDNSEPVFFLSDGSRLKVNKEDISYIFTITVTLEILSSFVTNLYKLRELGFIREGDYPWAVSLTDLRVISELSDTSSEFVHYLIRRIRLNELGTIQAHDELDWFGHYIQEGLYFEKKDKAEKSEKEILNLLSYTTPIDDYYSYVTGDRKTPAPKPRQPMPEVMKEIIELLDATHPDGYLIAAIALLDMDDHSRNDFSKLFYTMRINAIKDHEFHDFSMPFIDGDFGVTCMFGLSSSADKLWKRLQGYCILKKYALGIKTWVGFGCIVDANEIVSFIYTHNRFLEQNEEMDQLLESAPQLKMKPTSQTE